MSKKIVLTGGGTAGHVTPNLALLPYLKQEGYEVIYIGSQNGIERTLIEAEGIPYYGISTGKLRRYLSKENLKDVFKVLKGISEAKRLLFGIFQGRLCGGSRCAGCKEEPHSRYYP